MDGRHNDGLDVRLRQHLRAVRVRLPVTYEPDGFLGRSRVRVTAGHELDRVGASGRLGEVTSLRSAADEAELELAHEACSWNGRMQKPECRIENDGNGRAMGWEVLGRVRNPSTEG